MLRSCEETHDCEGCVTETRDCYSTCGTNVVGVIDQNLLQIHYDVQTELECKEHCEVTTNCSYYTYYYASDCILLSSLTEPLQQCDSCVTGPVDCDNFSEECSFIIDGEQLKHKIFDDPGASVELTFPHILACDMKIVLVGGGGYNNGVGGAGSGYIQYMKTTVNEKTRLVLTVGDERQSSVVTLDNQRVEAGPGHDSDTSNTGADGYSGGGAVGPSDSGCRGGQDGGDGEGHHDDGGQGTGEDVKSYSFDNYNLTGGSGGECWHTSDTGYYYGGGGGGVMVNGQGPHGEPYQGQGYGGGGGFHFNNHTMVRKGLPGVIILEIN